MQKQYSQKHIDGIDSLLTAPEGQYEDPKRVLHESKEHRAAQTPARPDPPHPFLNGGVKEIVVNTGTSEESTHPKQQHFRVAIKK